ncbi:MAG: sialate O-acetylesterase [Flavobacterium sp.]|uniref:sialate O-acetylesterase n=1 Tax=Flavobacterium sp. TaxID=239 RepID=UPI00260ECF9E|nr:sialate O-acetylesterase [Flavobacterium sp.]MDD5151218.1 sialate O-acetylesterase [Flavobacterium sp.]
MKKQYLFLLVILISSISINAQVFVAKIFADNMVLQRNTQIPVWGWAKPNEKIEVRFDKQIKKTKADKNGKWMIRLDNEAAGGPYNLTIKASNTIEIENVLVGEVWLCSGQSNMEMPVGRPKGWGISNYAEVSAVANYPLIRQIKIIHATNSLPESDVKTLGWQVCDPSTVGDFTALGYFFAKIIHEKLKIPVGIIDCNWGGTNIETWISREGFESSDEFKEMIAGMPKVSLDSIVKLKTKGFDKRIEAIQGGKINAAAASNFKESGFNDSKWPELNQPEIWEKQSLGEFDGVVWLRKSITLSADDSKKEAILELSTVDDDDVTYINGVKVGSRIGWNLERKYTIPVGILKEGTNVIAVRVTDNGGGGGIYGNAANLKLTIGTTIIPLSGKWKFQVESIKKTTNENSFPSLCYNAMINPLIPFAFQGVLWYQGESNAPRAYQYRTAFPLLINDWRQKWNKKFPFYFVQLATYKTTGNSNEGCDWAELQEAQTLTLKVPNTGMAVTTDIGNPNDIHPTNKLDVGKRLAALALNNTYTIPMVCSGPMYKSMEISGSEIIISFNDIGSGLFTPDKYGYIKGFEIAGEDQVFHYAKAFIKDNKVVVSSEEVSSPISVHFSWIGDASESNLFNKEGFPAVPFRTDEWKTITKDVKYKIAN